MNTYTDGNALERIKKLLKYMLMLFGIIFLIGIAMAGYTSYKFNQQSEAFNRGVDAYVDGFIQDLSKWQVQSLKPHLSHYFLTKTPEEKLGTLLIKLSSLGSYENHSKVESLGCVNQMAGYPSIRCDLNTNVTWSNKSIELILGVVQQEGTTTYQIDSIKFK
jgi:hypothetical protein